MTRPVLLKRWAAALRAQGPLPLGKGSAQKTRRDAVPSRPGGLLLVALGLGAVAFVSRLPFATQTLWAWDSVLYARALEEGFHVDHVVADARPHPPGYVFYVALAAVFRVALADTNAALVAVSALGTALAVVAIFLLARRFAGVGAAGIAAIGFASNPLVWLYGEVAYPYTLLAFLTIALAALFRRARGRRPRDRLVASALFGVALGFRQDLLLLLAPLWLWSLWPAGWRERAAHPLVLGAASLVWFVPSALLSDGVASYVESVLRQAGGVSSAYSVPQNGLEALSFNIRFTAYALAWGLLAFGVLLVGLAMTPLLWWLRTGRPRLRLHEDNAFFVLWLVPGTAFYVLVHIGEWGQALSVLPGFYVLVGALLPPLARALRGEALRWSRWAAAAFAVAPALVFLYVPDARFSADALADHDRAMAGRVAYVRANFSPESTIILAKEDYLQVRYYLTEYRTWYYDPDPYTDSVKRKRMPARQTTNVVFFTRGLQPERPRDLRSVELAPNVRLNYFVVEPGAVIEFSGTRFGVRERTTR